MGKKFLAILAFIFISCIPSVKLNVKPIKQSTNYWCWAASLAMIGRYYKGTDIRECEIVGSNNYTATGNLLGPTQCCADETADGKIHPICLRGGVVWDFILAFDEVLKLKYDYIQRPLSKEEVIQHLRHNHIILVVRHYIPNGHAHLIIGYDKETDMLLIAEPTPGKIISMKYETFKTNFREGIWRESFVILEQPTDSPLCGKKCLDSKCKYTILECLPNPQ